jgi:ribonuclease HI/exonuclease III
MGSPTPSFTIVSYNICGLGNDVRVAELRMFLAHHQPSVIIIQEPKLNHTGIVKRKGVVSYVTPRTAPQFYGYASIHIKHPVAHHAGIVFYIHASCTYMLRDEIHPFAQYSPDSTTTTAAFLWVSSPLLAHPVVIGGVYLDASRTTQAHVLTLRHNITRAARPPAAVDGAPTSPPLPVYVLGDFNARHEAWDVTCADDPEASTLGRIVHRHFVATRAAANSRHIRARRAMPLAIINTMFTTSRDIPTRESAGTVVDLAFTTHPHTIESMHVMHDSQLGSDHWPITISIPTIPPIKQGALPPRHIAACLEQGTRGLGRRDARPPSPDMEHKYDEADEKHGPHHYPPPPFPSARPAPLPPAPHADDADPPEDLFVNHSLIPGSGLGMFTNRPYRKDDPIIEYTGEIITEAQKQERYPDNDGQYVMFVKHDVYIDARHPSVSSIARYINSSAGGYNNARISVSHTAAGSKVTIHATRDIVAGSEVYFPYGSGFHMTRAQPPAKSTTTAPPSHWKQHMTAPTKTQTDGRTRWRINPDVDWPLFQQHIQPSLTTWMRSHRRFMPHDDYAASPPITQLEDTLHACAYTDGASRGNPGAASCGGVIYLAKDKLSPAAPATASPIYSFGKSLGIFTNNYAEYQGVIEALEAALQMGITHIKLYVDSQLVCRQMQGIYQVKKHDLMPQHARATTLASQMKECTLHHVMREDNKDADALCNRVLDMLDQKEDPASLQLPPDDHTHSHTRDNGLTKEQRQEIIERNTELELLAAAASDDDKQQSQPATCTQDQIDACWKQLHDIIIHSATSCVGKIDVMPHARHWWGLSPGIRELHTQYVKTRRNMRKTVHSTAGRHTAAEKAATQRQYVDARRAFTTAVREAKKQEWGETAAACDDHTAKRKHKLVWKAFKRTKASTRVAAASFTAADGTPPRTAQQALTNMAAHLASVSSLPQSALFDAAHEAKVRAYMETVPAAPAAPEPPSFSLEDVETVCSHFRLNTALGSDSISPYFLRLGGKLMHRAVHMLFSICSWYGVVPSQFRHAHVFTLYKGEGDVSDPNSYRPIAITSVLARVYERLHKKELILAMTIQEIPSPDQFGFTRQRSCHDAIYRLLSLLVETHANGAAGSADNHFVPAVFIDISKAYDKVWIDGLLYKLHHDLGIRGNLFYMIRALLTSRTIQVVCDGSISKPYDLTAGVPQGSILAPLLFLIYIHELTNIPGNNISVFMSLFADDIALAPLQCGTLGITSLSAALFHLSQYASKWRITFSAKKTNVVYFRPGRTTHGAGRTATTHTHGQLQLTGFNIDEARVYTYLGVGLDHFLTYIPHMTALTKRVRNTAQVIARLVRRCHAPSIPVIQALVKCVLVPQMTYGFPFIPPALLNDTVVPFRVADVPLSTPKGNLVSWLNRAMLQPIMRCHGVPFNVHHDSLRLEARLLSIQSLVSLECARAAHRWATSAFDAVNPAAALFRAHAVLPALPQSHPFNVIAQHIGKVSTLAAVTDVDDVGANGVPVTRRWLCNLRHIDRHKLKNMVWEQQYTDFLAIPTDTSKPKNMYMHPLHYLQPRINKTPTQRHLPLYTHMDTPHAANTRSRLRLGRARLRADQQRIGWPVPSLSCTACDGDALAVESVHHVLQLCPCAAAVRLRARANRRLTALYDKLGFSPDSKSRCPLSTNLVLRPWIDAPHPYDRWLRRIHTITGRYIIRLQQVWDF